MHLKPYLGLVLALFFLCAADRAFAQAAPAATEAKSPLTIGAGLSSYNFHDYGPGHVLGGTLWIDYSPGQVPQHLRGIGLQIEAKDLNYGRSKTLEPNLREDVASGGVFYSWPRFRNIRPYGKFEMGFGNVDYETRSRRHNQTRTVTSVGGGVELRAFRSVWVRADYEYQSWPDFFFHGSKPSGQLNPEGFTVGALYHFNKLHFR
jgi:opacity protein-like surface antigen